jgi:hypothetical protein
MLLNGVGAKASAASEKKYLQNLLLYFITSTCTKNSMFGSKSEFPYGLLNLTCNKHGERLYYSAGYGSKHENGVRQSAEIQTGHVGMSVVITLW